MQIIAMPCSHIGEIIVIVGTAVIRHISAVNIVARDSKNIQDIAKILYTYTGFLSRLHCRHNRYTRCCNCDRTNSTQSHFQ